MSTLAPFVTRDTPQAISDGTIRENMQAVIRFAGFGSSDERADYFRALNALQGRNFDFCIEPAAPVLEFGRGATAEQARALLSHLMGPSGTPPDWQYAPVRQREIRKLAQEGLALVAQVDPERARSVAQLVGAYVFGRGVKQYGGSTSNLLGVVWLGPPPSWDAHDYAEAMVHEFIHQALFLDDMVNFIFPMSVAEMESRSLVTSSVLRRKRAYDKSFHSAYVALGLASFCRRAGRPWHAYLGPLGVTIPELIEVAETDNYLTQHGLLRLDELAACYRTFAHDL